MRSQPLLEQTLEHSQLPTDGSPQLRLVEQDGRWSVVLGRAGQIGVVLRHLSAATLLLIVGYSLLSGHLPPLLR